MVGAAADLMCSEGINKKEKMNQARN